MDTNEIPSILFDSLCNDEKKLLLGFLNFPGIFKKKIKKTEKLINHLLKIVMNTDEISSMLFDSLSDDEKKLFEQFKEKLIKNYFWIDPSTILVKFYILSKKLQKQKRVISRDNDGEFLIKICEHVRGEYYLNSEKIHLNPEERFYMKQLINFLKINNYEIKISGKKETLQLQLQSGIQYTDYYYKVIKYKK